jgi:hypothetical protein
MLESKEYNVHLIHASSKRHLNQKWQKSYSQIKWVYLGMSYQKKRSWENFFDSQYQKLSIGRELQDVASALRIKYIQWVAELAKEYASDLSWWISQISNKNTLESFLFYKLCCLELIHKTIKSNKNLIIIVEEWDLLQSIKILINNSPIKITVEYSTKVETVSFLKFKLVKYLKFVWRWFRFLRFTIQPMLVPGKNSHLTQSRPDVNQPVAIIHTCINEGNLDKNTGTFQDRYFPGLGIWLKKKGFKVKTLPFPYQSKVSLKKLYQSLHDSQESFIIPQEIVSIKDYLSQIWQLLKLYKIPKGRFKFLNYDITPLVNEIKRDQVSRTEYAQFLVYIPMIKKLKKAGWNIQLFIDKFENMIKEKPQIYALRKYYPNCKIVGYQHASISPLMLKYTSTEDEFNNGLFPDYIVTNGSWFKECLSQNGIPKNKLKEGPALRSKYLFDLKNQDNPLSRCEEGKFPKKLMVILSLEMNMCIELLDKVLNCFSKDKNVLVYLKPHPMSNKIHLLNQIGRNELPQNFEWFNDNLSEALKLSDCTISIGSAAIMEAAAYGSPLVIIGRDNNLDLNPLAWWQDTYPEFKPVYQQSELIKAVYKQLNQNKKNQIIQLDKIKDLILACYGQVTEESMQAFLPQSYIK